MRTDITIQSFLSGLLLLGACFLGMMTGVGALVVIVSYFWPGLVFAFLLLQHLSEQVSAKKKVLLVLFSTAIHIACVFFVDVAHGDEVWTPVKLVMASSIGALLLSLAYDLLLFRRMRIIKTLVVPLLFGFIASLLSAFCLYYLHQVDFQQHELEILLWAGVFSIFPIWYSLMALNIKTRHKAAANIGFKQYGLLEKFSTHYL